MDLEDAPEPGGANAYESAPTTPMPVLGGGIPHQLHAVSLMTEAGGDLQAESAELTDSSTGSNEPPENDTSSRDGTDASSFADDGTDASSFADGAQTSTAARTTARRSAYVRTRQR